MRVQQISLWINSCLLLGLLHCLIYALYQTSLVVFCRSLLPSRLLALFYECLWLKLRSFLGLDDSTLLSMRFLESFFSYCRSSDFDLACMWLDGMGVKMLSLCLIERNCIIRACVEASLVLWTIVWRILRLKHALETPTLGWLEHSERAHLVPLLR